MKTLTLLILLVLIVRASCYLIKVPTVPELKPTIAPIGWVHMQKLILPLFDNICEESRDPIIVKLSQDFKLDTTNDSYLKPEIIKNILDFKTNNGFLPKNEIFTEYNNDHLNELKVIYGLLYNANNFNTFYKAACWARQNINCGLFIDALYSAILTRKDMENVFIPAPYEILPNYFIRKDFIIKASTLLAGEEITPQDYVRIDGNSYIFDVNYTSNVYENVEESKLVYFYEDIGLNSYYYLLKLKMSSWINSDYKGGRYGEYLYSLIKQLMARYNLERYSAGLPEIEGIDWESLNTISSYDPMLVYSDGNDFSQRTLRHLENSEKLTLIKNIENNIATVVTHMREGGFKKSDILNHLMEILMTSDKSYENLALEILNEETTINKRPPSVLGHYMTTLRDPIFWAINKKMVEMVDTALKVLPGYTREELYFPGVEILNVEVKKMMTTFDNFVFDVTEALEIEGNDTNFKVKMSQSRLNHKPFSIKVNITSLVSQKGLLRIYLGPKIMPGEHALKKNLFMLLDCFEINLKYGNNIFTRSSADISDNSDDLLSLYAIRKIIADAEFGLDSKIKLKPINEKIKFPSRLVIPKGLPEGLPLQIFVFVVPLGNTLGGRLINTDINKDAYLSPGFPLDLDIEVQQLFNLPNALVKDIFVVHKESGDQTVKYGEQSETKSWQNNDYSQYTPSEPVVLLLADRPDFNKRKEPFDYKSRRGQYGIKEDYAAKRVGYNYKKDQILDNSFSLNNDDHISNHDVTTDKIPIKSLDYVTDSNFDYIVTTPMVLHAVNEDKLSDKKIIDKGISEEIHATTLAISDENLLLADEPDFTMKKKLFDYKSKKGQYGKKEDYAAKRGDYKMKYKKDKELYKSSTNSSGDHITKLDINTNKMITYLPDDVTRSEKDSIKFIITTDRSFDADSTFMLDKIIKDIGSSEEIHIDVTNNDKIVSKETNKYFNHAVNKMIVKNENNAKYNKMDKTVKHPKEILWNNFNEYKNVFVTNEDEFIQKHKSGESDDSSSLDTEETYDIPKTSLVTNQPPGAPVRDSTIYDILFNPFDGIYGSNEKVYE